MNETTYQEMKEKIIQHFALTSYSVHGVDHWTRVERNGLLIALEDDTVDVTVVRYFSIFHDSRRLTEVEDDLHGPRAMELLLAIGPDRLDLTHNQFSILVYAVEGHTDGVLAGNSTVGSCWDADRLDLGRVGTLPDPKYMSTKAGKKIAVAVAANLKQKWEVARAVAAARKDSGKLFNWRRK